MEPSPPIPVTIQWRIRLTKVFIKKIDIFNGIYSTVSHI